MTGEAKQHAVGTLWARVLVVVLTTLPLAALGFYSFRLASHSVRRQVDHNNRAAAVTTAELVRRELIRGVELAEGTARSPALIDAMVRHDEEGVRSLLKAFQQSFITLDRAYVTDPDGLLWSDYPRAPESLGKNFSHRDWYQQMFPEGKACVSAVYQRNAAPRPLVVAVASPVRREQTIIGTVVYQFRVDGLSNWLKQVEVGDGGYVFVVDHTGALAAHPHANLTERRYEDYASTMPLREALGGNGITSVYADPLTGETMLASGVAIELRGQRWVVVAQQSYQRALAPVRTMGISIFVATGLLALGLLLAGTTMRRAQEREQRLNSELALRNNQLETLTRDLEASVLAEKRARVELEETFRQLQATQSHLVRSEKLASLGQLVAGVAHELNNPLAFVINNVAVLQRDFSQMRQLLSMYEEVCEAPADGRGELTQRVQGFAEQIDLSYVLGSLDGVLSRSREGLRRIQQIVKDLREFSRQESVGEIDEGVDLNDGIRSTLNILHGRAARDNVVLESNFGALPPITCQPAKINQVMMNLLANAVDACLARFEGKEGGKVMVESRAQEEGVEIVVRDNGCGIPPEHVERIYDPFFTTKPVGKGTGLGLSITHGIVNEHGGRIEVQSQVGSGTRFTVWLPRVPPASLRSRTPVAAEQK